MSNTKVSSEQIIDDVALGGNPTTTTQSAGNNTTRVATTAFVTTAVSNLVDSAPSNLDTLNELAAAMNDNASFFSTVLPLSGGTMTGNIAHASDFTLDVGGTILLDSGDGIFKLRDDGSDKGRITVTSDIISIVNSTQDGDIKFDGLDGSSSITALRLDMSEGGTAQFAHDIEMVDNGLLRMGAGGDLILTSDGTHGTIFTNNGTLTLDSSARIDLSADDNGEVRLFDGSSMYAQFKDDSDRLSIQALISDADILFVGNDGGSEVTALTLDMSDAGAALFNGNIALAGGADRRIQLSNSGTSGVNFTSNNTVHIRGDNDSLKLMAAGNGSLIYEENGTEHLSIASGGELKFNSGFGSSATAFGVRAWVNFDGNISNDTAIEADGNVSSVVDNAVGDYTINFGSNMPDGHYAVSGFGVAYASNNAAAGAIVALHTSGTGNYIPTTKTASAVRVVFGYGYTAGLADIRDGSIIIVR